MSDLTPLPVLLSVSVSVFELTNLKLAVKTETLLGPVTLGIFLS